MSDRRDWVAADASVEAIVRGSLIYRAADGALASLQRAWPGSRASRAAIADATTRIRFWSLATVVAGATVLLLGPRAATPRPVGWLVPAVCGALALAVLALTRRSAGGARSNR